MTDDDLRAHWGETTPVPRVPRKIDPAALLVACVVGLVVLVLLIVGAVAEGDRAEEREIRVCEMAKVMSGEADALGAEYLCARDGWQR